MKNRILFLICFCLSVFALPASSQDSIFYRDIKRYSLTFKMPAGFKEVPIIENDDVKYNYAVRNGTDTLEVRYRIWPVDTSAPPANEFRVNPNTIFSGMLEAIMLNISGGKEGNHGLFDSSDVNKEFNANSGGTAFVECHSVFGKGYSYCMITVIHRDNVADAYTFYLFNDRKEIQKTINRLDVFYALKFK